jgi:cytoskeleton protein RodZ
VASLGARLKQEREKQGITLEQISLSTKIGTRMLRALEEEHFDQLPGGIFNKGFIRAYARSLGMDEEQAIADYLAASTTGTALNKSEANGHVPFAESPSQEEREENEEAGSLPWGIFATVLLTVALGFTAWGFYSRESHKETRDSAVPATDSSNVSPPASTNPSPPEQKPIESPGPSATASKPGRQTASIAASAPAASAIVGIPATKTFLVLIKARQDSWISITVDGEVVTQETLIAPTEKSVRAEKEITIRAGNVGALDFEFNGEQLPVQGSVGEVKTLTFDAHGLRPSATQTTQPQ